MLLGWIALLVALTGLNATVGGVFKDEFSLPDSESADAVATPRGVQPAPTRA